MRAVDLALYADTLAARASALSAQLERARDGLRQRAIEREARRALSEETVARLEAIGVLSETDAGAGRAEVTELAARLSALEELQAWVERALFEAGEEGAEQRGDDWTRALAEAE